MNIKYEKKKIIIKLIFYENCAILATISCGVFKVNGIKLSKSTGSCDKAKSGISFLFNDGLILNSCSVKLNNGGRGFPVSNTVFCCLNSLKNGCVIASIAVNLLVGVYSNNDDNNSKASGVVTLPLKTFCHSKKK